MKENGSNFALGERQLFCLTRALLRKSRILLLDEATASVDIQSDEIVQNALRTSFPNTTILVIAHRLNTVMELSRILVMRDGEVAELDTPSRLVDDPKVFLSPPSHPFPFLKHHFLRNGSSDIPNLLNNDF